MTAVLSTVDRILQYGYKKFYTYISKLRILSDEFSYEKNAVKDFN